MMALHRWENSFCLAAVTVVTALFFSYRNTTNCSIFSNASYDRFAFSVPTSKKQNKQKTAIVENAVHVFQAFSCFCFFPFQPKNETVSQSVTAWKAGKTLDLSAPRLEAIAWAAVYLKCFPVPNATPLFLQPQRLQVQQRQCQQFVLLSSSAALRNTRVSASSWVHPLIWFCGWWDHAVTASGDEYFARNWSSFNFFGKKAKQSLLFLSFF